MKIHTIFSFLTYPGKHASNQPQTNGTFIPNSGKLYNMLCKIFDNSDLDCNIPIVFLSDDQAQNNVVRDEIVKLVTTKDLADGLVLAQRLQKSTTEKSGMGLVFFTIGTNGNDHKIVISRFPADEGIVANRQSSTLMVEFVEEVFLKSAHSYKSAMYKFQLPIHALWTGNATDKQVNHGAKEVAAYWINDFLKSDFQTTPKQGTKRLAHALKQTIEKTTDKFIKHEITSCVNLAKNIPNVAMSIAEFCDQFHLSKEAKEEICSHVKPSRLISDKFSFDKDEFDKHLSYKMVELDNGAVLTSEASKFDECFDTAKIEGDSNKIRFITTGEVVDEKLKRSK